MDFTHAYCDNSPIVEQETGSTIRLEFVLSEQESLINQNLEFFNSKFKADIQLHEKINLPILTVKNSQAVSNSSSPSYISYIWSGTKYTLYGLNMFQCAAFGFSVGMLTCFFVWINCF